MNPELRRRLIDSIEYLRKMGFFEDYSSLSSEEILEKIFNGEIDYEDAWWIDREIRKSPREPEHSEGRLLIWSLREHENIWLKSRDAEFDYWITPFDTKRMLKESSETMPEEGMGVMILKRLARISRGVFNPTDIREEWSKYTYREFEKLKDKILGLEKMRLRYYAMGEQRVDRCRVFFRFGGEEHYVDFYCDGDFLYMKPAMLKINELIKDNGYQYYSRPTGGQSYCFVVLMEEEAEKLRKERSWELYS